MTANDTQIGGTHYGSKTQHWDVCWQLVADQFQYCVTKYVSRHRRKAGVEDLHKASHHLTKYIECLVAGKMTHTGLLSISELELLHDFNEDNELDTYQRELVKLLFTYRSLADLAHAQKLLNYYTDQVEDEQMQKEMAGYTRQG